MSNFKLATEMQFRGGRAVFFAKAKEGMCYPLGFEKKHVIDGEVVGGGGGPAYFKDHLWSTELSEYAAGMVKSPHFMDPEGYVLDPSCLPAEALTVWPTLDRKGKQLLCLALISGQEAEEAVASLPVSRIVNKTSAAPTTEATEIYECPAGCGVKVEDDSDPDRAKAAIITHVRLMHPGWQG